MKKFKEKCFEESGVRNNLRAMFRGALRVMCGATIAGLIGVSAYCFANVPSNGGYMAVMTFLSGAVFLAASLWSMWAIGGGKKRAGAYEK